MPKKTTRVLEKIIGVETQVQRDGITGAKTLHQEFPLLRFFVTPLQVALLALILLLISVCCFPPKIEISLPKGSFVFAGGQTYWVSLRFIKKFGFRFRDEETSRGNSSLSLTENTSQLIPSPRDYVGREQGRFFRAGDNVYLSTSDGSDPKSNHKNYKIGGQIDLTSTSLLTCAALLITLAMLERTIRKQSNGLNTAMKAVRSRLNARIPFEVLRKTASLHSSKTKYIPELDGIRGYACLSVLVAHCLVGVMDPPNGSFLFYVKSYTCSLLLSGVDLFFVLSGFLIGGILMDCGGEKHFFKRFWIRRIARIVPVLWLLLASYAIALMVRANFNLPQLDLWLLAKPLAPFWTYATFTQSIPLALGGLGPRWVGITWSLAIEEQFYLFFPFVVYFLSRRSLLLTVVAGILLSPFFRVFFAHTFGNWFASYVLLPSRIDGLMFGVLVAIVVRNTRVLITAMRCRWLLDALALTIIYLVSVSSPLISIWPDAACGPFPPLKQTFLSVLFAILILRVFLYKDDLLNRIWKSPILIGFGLISYGLYMYHQSINGLVHAFVWQQEPLVKTGPQFLASLLIMLSAIFVAILSSRYVEKPIRNAGHKLAASFSK